MDEIIREKTLLLGRLRAFAGLVKKHAENQSIEYYTTQDPSLLSNLTNRYRALRGELYGEIEDGDLIRDFGEISIANLTIVTYELEFASEVLEKEIEVEREIQKSEAEASSNPTSNETAGADKTTEDYFSDEEKVEIVKQLGILQGQLLEIADTSSKTRDEVARLTRIVSSEFDDIKKQSGILNKKDWKNHLVATLLNLALLFSFSVEARKTMQFSYELLINVIYNETVRPDQIPPVTDTFLLGETEDK